MSEPDPDRPDRPAVADFADRLRAALDAVTVEEFRAQQLRYDRDSRHGRELLYLVANSEWMRGTTEFVTATRADAVDTTVQVEIDLDHIRHEAFFEADRVWLPLLVLPAALPATGNDAPAPGGVPRLVRWLVRRPTPPLAPAAEPLVTLPVTDAGGALVPALPVSEVHHRLAAGLAEVILTMAVARWVGRPADVVASRDSRMLLAAAIFRLLRNPAWRPDGAGPGSGPARRQRPIDQETISSAPGRMTVAAANLDLVLERYLAAPERPGAGLDNVTLLTTRAVGVLQAFIGASVVVVAADRGRSPGIFTVKVPTRRVRQVTASPVRRPRASLAIDRLVPAPDAVRQVQMSLPDGLTTELRTHDVPSPRSRLRNARPRAFDHLSGLMVGVLDDELDAPVRRCVAELAVTKVDAALEALRHYGVDPDTTPELTRPLDDRLGRLRDGLSDLTADGGSATARTAVAEIWMADPVVPAEFWRRASLDAVSPRTVTLRTEAIEDPIQRAAPVEERLHLDLTVTDSNLFDVARYAGSMSLVLLAAILAFLTLSRAHLNAEVLAGALTLFSAVQAGRVEHPDRSLLRGLVGASGYWIIVASVLPTVVFAVTLAFVGEQHERGWAIAAAAAALCLQGVLQLVMTRGPLADVGTPGTPPGLELVTEPHPDHARIDVLRSQWWRSTTAEALLLGREAHAYVSRQQQGELRSLLTANPGNLNRLVRMVHPGANGAGQAAPIQSVLGLLRAGTLGEALTFVVLREEPDQAWRSRHGVRPVELDVDRLAPVEIPADAIELYFGLPVDSTPPLSEHPLKVVADLAAAENLLLLDVQLPVPPPVTLDPTLRWARVRVGVRELTLPRIGPFLQALRRRAAGEPGSGWQLWAQMMPEGVTRPLIGAPVRWVDPGPMSSSELDVTGVVDNGARESRDWRVLAICADARPGVEADVLTALSTRLPGLGLAGLATAQVHGISVIFVLGRGLTASAGAADLADLVRDGMSDHVTILVDEQRTAAQLAGRQHAAANALLRAHVLSQDRPGLLLQALQSLQTQLPAALRSPTENGTGGVEPWYVHLQVAEGRVARIAMTLRVTDAAGGPQLTETALAAATRNVRRDLASSGPPGAQTGGLGTETVVSIKPVLSDRAVGTEPAAGRGAAASVSGPVAD